MKRLFTIISIVGIGLSINAQTVKVAAAGNLKFILDEIKSLYNERDPKIKLEFSFGSSGALTQQICNGAGYDVFMAADKIFPDKLKSMGNTAGEVRTYAFGKLVLWSNTLKFSKGIEMVKNPDVRHIAIAKPEVSPYGARAVECLKYHNLYNAVKDKFVFANNIAQAAVFAESGNAELGFIALAIALSPDMKNKGSYMELDPKSYKPVEQAMVLLKTREFNSEAKKFMDFVLSAECKPIFVKYGFIVP